MEVRLGWRLAFVVEGEICLMRVVRCACMYGLHIDRGFHSQHQSSKLTVAPCEIGFKRFGMEYNTLHLPYISISSFLL